jgi:conjugal transfer pilus assembly protein TraF
MNRIKPWLLVQTLIFGVLLGQGSAYALEPVPKKGYLWYNLPKGEPPLKKRRAIPFSNLSHQQRTKVLHYFTMESLHKARQTHDVKDMEVFLSFQRYWLNEASIFQHNFQYALLRKPELDPTVKNPTSAIGTSLNEQKKGLYRQKAISELTKHYGLMFFYQGASPYSEKQAYVLKDFAHRYQFKYIPVSVDGVLLDSMPNSRRDSGQAKRLHVGSYPALILVEPKTGQTMPVSHGFVTQDYLTENFETIAKELARGRLGEGVLYE